MGANVSNEGKAADFPRVAQAYQASNVEGLVGPPEIQCYQVCIHFRLSSVYMDLPLGAMGDLGRQDSDICRFQLGQSAWRC